VNYVYLSKIVHLYNYGSVRQNTAPATNFQYSAHVYLHRRHSLRVRDKFNLGIGLGLRFRFVAGAAGAVFRRTHYELQ